MSEEKVGNIPRAALEAAGRMIAGGEPLSLGDVDGHPFRGNQYSDGKGGGSDAPKREHDDGAKVRVPLNGKLVSGKVVRYDKGDPGGSPFYIVDVGTARSEKVAAHEVHAVHDDGNHIGDFKVRERFDRPMGS